jgi:hypothetical protein
MVSLPSDPPLIPLAESLELLGLVKLCQYRSTAGCGCSGARCALRVVSSQLSVVGEDDSLLTDNRQPTTGNSSLVSHLDCLECMRIYGLA